MRRILINLLSGALIALAALVPLTVPADDTDIYTDPYVPVGGEPLVMLVLDWRPNLGSNVSCAAGTYCDSLRARGYLQDGQPAGSGSSTTFFNMFRAVLLEVLDPMDGVRIGFMLNHEGGNCAGFPPPRSCSNGAYIYYGFQRMDRGTDDPNTWQTAGEDPDKVALATKLAALPVPSGNLSHPFQGKEVYFELFRYLTGQGIYNGHNGYVDFGDPPNDNQNLDVDLPSQSWDTSVETGGGSNIRYESPLLSATPCSKIFMINFLFQVSQQEDDSDPAIMDTKANGGMAGIDLTGQRNSFDTVVEYMNDVDLADGTFGTAPNMDGTQNVVSYFLADPSQINQTVIGYATAGGSGVPYELSEESSELRATIDSIFRSILGVSTTFVAPSVPVNVFNRSQILNEVFMALFEPDENSLPFWPGNLKKLAIAQNPITGVPELQDATGTNAIDADGRIKREALTYWTLPAALPAPDEEETAGRDGRSIKRGGAGQKIPGFIAGAPGLDNGDVGARRVFTEDPADATDRLRPVGGDDITATAEWDELTSRWNPGPSAGTYAGASNAEKARSVNALRYARGLAGVDVRDTSTSRDWYLGDPLHSRPRPVNYGARGGHSATNPDIRVLMATTDGQMHMFRNTAPDGTQSGAESWAFIPGESLAYLERLRTASLGTPLHPIALDGSPVVLTIDNNLDGTIDAGAGDKAYAYFGQRRGGKSYYALDISNPDAPKFRWKINKADTGFNELGQTWSTPVVGKLDLGSGPRHVLIFGGGYNGDDDGDNAGDLGKDEANRIPLSTPSDDDEGNAVFIVDALSGALLWKATQGSLGYSAASSTYRHPDLRDSIPADIGAADTTGDGLIDRLYFADTGGLVWRADLAGNSPAAWSMMPLLNAGRHFDNSAANDLRFFNRPDIVRSRDGNGNFDGVLIGSGDRENPKDTTVQNYFFMIKDRATTSGTPPADTLDPDDLADLTDNCVASGSCGADTLDDLNTSGWFIALGAPGEGEKNLANAITIGGTVFFTDFLPSAPLAACVLSEGAGRQYAINLQTGEGVFNYNTANDDQGETYDRYDELASGGIPVEIVPLGDNYILVQGQEAGQNIQQVPANTSWRTYWYETEE